jgi:predicted O-linked N-acetylglucosamine transferase (SPINDLY family)
MRSLIISLVLPGNALACTPAQIEAATSLMLQTNPLIQAERQELAEQSRQRDWSAKLILGYAMGSTDDSAAAGPNAGIQVEIPLFDRAKELKVAEARSAFQQQRDDLLSDFLSHLEKICSQEEQVRELDTMRRFYRDRLRYRQEQVKEGLEEAGSLWKEAEKAQETEHDYRRERGELEAMRLAIARRFGGQEWKRLRDLLAEAGR